MLEYALLTALVIIMLLYKDLQQLYTNYNTLHARLLSLEQRQAKQMKDASFQTANTQNHIPRPRSLIQLKSAIKAHNIVAHNPSRQHSNSAHSPIERSSTLHEEHNSVQSIASNKYKTFENEHSATEPNNDFDQPHIPSMLSARELNTLNPQPVKREFNNIESNVMSPIYSNKHFDDSSMDNNANMRKHFSDTSTSKLSYLKKIGLQDMAKHKIINTIKVHNRMMKDNDDSQGSFNANLTGLLDQKSFHSIIPLNSHKPTYTSNSQIFKGIECKNINLVSSKNEKLNEKNCSLLEESKQKAKELFQKESEMGETFKSKAEKIKHDKLIAQMRRDKIKNLSDQCRKAAAAKRGSSSNKI
jgi:hypothetical protein